MTCYTEQDLDTYFEDFNQTSFNSIKSLYEDIKDLTPVCLAQNGHKNKHIKKIEEYYINNKFIKWIKQVFLI